MRLRELDRGDPRLRHVGVVSEDMDSLGLFHEGAQDTENGDGESG